MINMFNEITKNEQALPITLILEYCDENNIEYPLWLESSISTGHLPRYKIWYPEKCWYVANIDPIHKFAEYSIWIIDNLEGNWSIMEHERISARYVFRLAEEAMAFKLMWL